MQHNFTPSYLKSALNKKVRNSSGPGYDTICMLQILARTYNPLGVQNNVGSMNIL